MTETKNVPEAPSGLGVSGKKLWDEVLEPWELDQHELLLLTEACRTVDQLDLLDAAVKEHGIMLPDGRMHPALVEARQQRITLTRLIASLRLPEGLEDGVARPQRRGAARGSYSRPGLRGGN